MIFHGIDLRCPRCRADLEREGGDDGTLVCRSGGHRYPVLLGIPDLRIDPDPYVGFDEDREKGRLLAAELDRLDFEGLLDFYYRHTPVVPPAHARLYVRGLLGAAARSQATLDAWEGAPDGLPSGEGALLDLGCGTGPMLVAAAKRYRRVVGVDVAFRWLVVARRRLREAGVEAPLIAACAEALPFADASFDRVTAESVLEVVRDPAAAARECHRVLGPGGVLFLATPNRSSPGPDPHTGVWGGTLLPESWTAWWVRRQGGLAPKRQLFTARTIERLLRDAGFGEVAVRVPAIPEVLRRRFGWPIRSLIGAYELARRLPGSGGLLLRMGPLLHAVASRPRGRAA